MFFIKVTLRSGAMSELGFEDEGRAMQARDVIMRPEPGDISVIGQPARFVMDDFGHAFSVRADDVAACCFVDLAAELLMGQKAAAMHAAAQEEYKAAMQRRTMAQAKLLVPAGIAGVPAAAGPRLMNGGRTA